MDPFGSQNNAHAWIFLIQSGPIQSM